MEVKERDERNVMMKMKSSFSPSSPFPRRLSCASSSHEEDDDDDDDEVELQWAAIERLPTFTRLRTSLFDMQNNNNNNMINIVQHGSTKLQEEPAGAGAGAAAGGVRGKLGVIDVRKLVPQQKQVFISKLLRKIEQDNHLLLQKLRDRIARVGLELPGVEVRYEDLCVEAKCEVVEAKSLPTLWNTLKSIFSAMTNVIRHNSQANRVKILQDVRGIIKPSRLTLLLGPPGCGKTTFLLALAGKLDTTLKVEGDISYNGYKLKEFVPQKTAAYISQYDLHISEMTVRETLDFAARCQGTGSRAEILTEVIRREKQAGIIPEPDIDTYMKAIAIEGLKRTLQTDYVLRILGLDICADTIVGDAMRRGISGGQKKRLTTGEMIVGPAKVLLMDEISNGLDSSTTFQIVTCLQQWTHISGSTILVSLLQPAPETFDLFDDIILMAEGKTVYHGPRDNVLEFFEQCGFRCPPRKGIADFTQEVVSKKDQAQYWYPRDKPYNYVSVEEFGNTFKKFHAGQNLDAELSQPFNKSDFHKNALSFNIHSVHKWELFKACMAREWLLMKRNSFLHVFRTLQLVVIGFMTMTIFIRTRMKIDVIHANYYMGSLFYALIRLMSNGIAELSMTVSRLGVFYKQRDFYFYPTWAYSIPSAILKIPFSFLDAFLWTALTYYVIGYSPEPGRFVQQILLLFVLHQVSISSFRLIASVFQHPSVAVSCGLFSLIVMSLFGGFIIPQLSLPAWLKWGFWLSPLTYAEIGASVNEFLAPRWQKFLPSNLTIGQQVLTKRGLNYAAFYYWVSIGSLVGFWLLFNIGFTCALSFLKPPGRSRAVISHERQSDLRGKFNRSKISQENKSPHDAASKAPAEAKEMGMIFPFEPMTITFENVQYFVDTPKKLREQGFEQKRLQLLQDITGAFRPGVLTALMGVSGAGKTTLMDVLSGRKTGGIIEGDIRVGGYPKVQATFARISGYCEQTDIHSPQITIKESLTYSAWLRLPSQIHPTTKFEFVAEVLQLIELDDIKDALVGFPGVSGISNEQRKRLTIAVELVSNPSIIFMDEPTSGLDARAAAIVMRVVKNIVNTKRTIVCTIHQPSIDIFETFDELILMKRGGQIIYSGELGQNSSKLIKYFEVSGQLVLYNIYKEKKSDFFQEGSCFQSEIRCPEMFTNFRGFPLNYVYKNIPGVAKIHGDSNPATWMLEVTSQSAEAQLGLDFSSLYKESLLYLKTKELVRELSSPAEDSKDLHFSTSFPQNGWEQFKACLWKQHLSYWRNPNYNLVRLTFITTASLLFGAVLWQKGKKINDEQDLINILGAMFILIQFLGIGNCSSVLPYIATERTIVYRERFAGMYSSWAYSFAQVTVEIPYIFVQVVIFVIITYPAVDFYWSVDKVFWYFYISFCTMLYFTYLGMVLVSITPNSQVASVLASFFYTILSLFSGFLIPGPRIPNWWIWCYWICPAGWSLRGLFTSQYGDIEKEITVFGEQKAVNAFLGNYFGYHHDKLGAVALVLAAFPIILACAFAYSVAKLNFQRR